MITVFKIKDINQNQPNEETHRVRSGRVPNTAFPCPFPMESGGVTFPHMNAFTSQEAHQSIGCPEFLLGFHFVIGMIDCTQSLVPL